MIIATFRLSRIGFALLNCLLARPQFLSPDSGHAECVPVPWAGHCFKRMQEGSAQAKRWQGQLAVRAALASTLALHLHNTPWGLFAAHICPVHARITAALIGCSQQETCFFTVKVAVLTGKTFLTQRWRADEEHYMNIKLWCQTSDSWAL